MDRERLLAQLSQAETHLAQGEMLVARQRVILETLKRRGHHVTEAEELLRQLEAAHSIQVAEHVRLLRELAR